MAGIGAVRRQRKCERVYRQGWHCGLHGEDKARVASRHGPGSCETAVDCGQSQAVAQVLAPQMSVWVHG